MKFEVGNKVSFVDEAGNGIITEIIDKKNVRVINSAGFELTYSISKLVPHVDLNDYRIPAKEEDKHIRTKIKSEQKKTKSSKPSNHKIIWEIDLHIEELTDDYKRLTNTEILEIQMRHFTKFMGDAIEKKIQKVVIIHGKGEGVLKNEIRTALFAYGNLEIHDASYTKYGQGATEVVIHTNK